jgi:hypothetical protein
MSALLLRPAPMPAVEMAGFECVSPVCFPVIEMAGFRNHLVPTTIESGPQSGSTRVSLNPASRIQPQQSAVSGSLMAVIRWIHPLWRPAVSFTSRPCGFTANDKKGSFSELRRRLAGFCAFAVSWDPLGVSVRF